MKKNLKRALCLALCIAMTVSTASCELLLGELPPFSFSGGYFDEESSTNDDSSSGGVVTPTPEPEEPNPTPTPEPEEPNPEKELLRTETDSLGHKIAYYSDGTWEDLGRAVALDFTPEKPTERYGYQELSVETKANGLRGFYMDLYNAAVQFSSSTADVEKDGNYHSIANVSFSKHGLSYEEGLAAYKTFTQDYPEFYWTSGSFGVSETELLLCVESDYANYSDRVAVQTAIEAAALDCDKYVNGMMSETERAVIIHDYLATEITYAYDSNGTPSEAAWAHNIVGWATRNAGVCETYAETFTYLCDLFDVECVTVVGVAAMEGPMGAHAWNILKLEGEWYAVDVTWNDAFETTYSHIIDRSWFGKAGSEFSNSHVANSPENGLNITYQFEMPTLSENALSPVLFSENGGKATWLASIDKAFEKMTNEQGRYAITLYPATKVLSEMGGYVYCSGAVLPLTLPKVEELYIKGTNTIIDETKFYKSVLFANGVVTANSNLILEQIDFYAKDLKMGKYKLTSKEGVKYYLG